MIRLLLPVLAGLCSLAAYGQTAAAGTSALDKAALEAYIRHLYVWGDKISVRISDPKPSETLPGFQEVVATGSAGQASQAITYYVTPDGKRFIQGSVYDITKNPFETDAKRIRTDLQPSFGEAGAPVVVAVYSDFQCGFCREEAKMIRQTLRESFPKDVRVYYKDFPLESIHPWAKPAAIAGRCIFRQKPAAFWDYHDWIFDKQEEITPDNLKSKTLEFLKTKGLAEAQFSSCFDSKATLSEVERSQAEGRALGIDSTPTLFVNGRRMVGQVPWPNLKQVIEHEIEYSKKNGGGEKCCEVKLPSPLNQ